MEEISGIQRDGINLRSTISISYLDAILGAVVKVNCFIQYYACSLGSGLFVWIFFIVVTCKTTFLFITYLQCTKLQIEFLVSEMKNLRFMLFIHPYG